MRLIVLLSILPTFLFATEWQLVFFDEFTDDGEPNAMKWGYEEGFIRNREPQWYTSSLENVGCSGGVLRLTARKLEKPHHNPNYRVDAPEQDWKRVRKDYHYTSGSIETRGRFEFLYGKVEVRAKLPQGRGVWPAIWTLGRAGEWPNRGEIDVMEYIWDHSQTIWSTLHFTNSAKLPLNQRSGQYTSLEVQDDDWHLYGMEWTRDMITFTFDKVPFFSFPIERANRPDGTNPFRQPHYLKLNLALGAGEGVNWGGILDDAILPQTFAVDYVRIYQHLPEN